MIKIRTNKIKFDFIPIIVPILLTFLIYFNTDMMDYYHPHFQNPWDHHKYLWMAINNLDFNIAPFCWRVFVPFLASLLPFEISINFKLIAFISIMITGFFVFKIGMQIFDNFSQSLSMMIAYFSLSFATKYVLYDFWLVDAFTILLITSGTYCILTKKDFAFEVILIIGALTKESVLFLLPLFYSLRAKKIFDLQILKKTLLISLAPILVFIMIRIIIPPMNSLEEYLQSLPPQLRVVNYESAEYNLNFLINQVAFKKINNFSFHLLYRITIYTFMIHLILSLFNFNAIKKWLPRFLPFIILTYVQILFAVNEERIVIITFIPILIFSVAGLNNFLSKLPYQNFSMLFLNIMFFLLVLPSSLFYSNWVIIRQVLFLIIYLIILILIKKLGNQYLIKVRNS